jgi:hypothetical protein
VAERSADLFAHVATLRSKVVLNTGRYSSSVEQGGMCGVFPAVLAVGMCTAVVLWFTQPRRCATAAGSARSHGVVQAVMVCCLTPTKLCAAVQCCALHALCTLS